MGRSSPRKEVACQDLDSVVATGAMTELLTSFRSLVGALYVFSASHAMPEGA